MSTHFKHYKSGQIFGIVYKFDKAGEGLRMHFHDDDLLHNVTVLHGSVLFYGPNGKGKTKLVTGQIFDFDGTEPHEIAALEDGTVIFNGFLNGQPEGYINLPPEELDGFVDVQMTHKIADLQNPIPVMVH